METTENQQLIDLMKRYLHSFEFQTGKEHILEVEMQTTNDGFRFC